MASSSRTSASSFSRGVRSQPTTSQPYSSRSRTSGRLLTPSPSTAIFLFFRPVKYVSKAEFMGYSSFLRKCSFSAKRPLENADAFFSSISFPKRICKRDFALSLIRFGAYAPTRRLTLAAQRDKIKADMGKPPWCLPFFYKWGQKITPFRQKRFAHRIAA